MAKYLGTFKTNQTMYYDYNSCYWDIDKPEGKYGYDYTLMRKGLSLKAHELPEEIAVDFEDYKIALGNGGNHQVYFKSLEDVHKCRWLHQVDEREDKSNAN